MKNLLPVLFFLFFCPNLIAQDLPNRDFNLFETIPCPFDPALTIKVYQDWVIYQTLDGKRDGPIDSTICIGLGANSIEGFLLEGADLDKPIFIRSKLTDDNKILLEPNTLYSAVAYEFFQNNEVTIDYGVNCPDNMCSGLFIGIEVPDSTGTGNEIRWYTDAPSSIGSGIYFETCVPTEYFDENYLREFIIKLSVQPGTQTDDRIRMGKAYISSSNGTNYLHEVIAPANSFVDTSYQVDLHEVGEVISPWFGPNYLMRYNDIGSWPSMDHPSYVEGRPEVNTPDPQTIDLNIHGYEVLVPQPFTFLRGALVEGSDSVRHQVNLVNNGGDVCMGGIVDLVFGSGTKYVHHDGHLDFGNRSTCLMFEKGGTLEVADGSELYYGQSGKGILALRSGSTILLGSDSKLLIDNLLWLQGIPSDAFPDHQIYMKLNPGSTLAFGEHASIINHLSQFPDTRLNIYMNGGTLDDRQLSPASRSLINKIYPPASDNFSKNIALVQNPVGQLAKLKYLSDINDQADCRLFDLGGKLLGRQQFLVQDGMNHFEFEMKNIPAGIYMLQVETSVGGGALKVVKME